MSIEVLEKDKIIRVNIPLTTVSGKVRVKQRDAIFDYGIPFATKQNPFNQKNYIEWQIGYDALVPPNEKNFDKKRFLNFNNTTLKNIRFCGSNGKNKALYELSEYLYYFIKWKSISEQLLRDVRAHLSNTKEESLLDQHKHCQIKRTNPRNIMINDTQFSALTVEYPQLIYRFEQYEIIAEIVIREKQKAIGIQPMLYFCFPITELQAKTKLMVGLQM